MSNLSKMRLHMSFKFVLSNHIDIAHSAGRVHPLVYSKFLFSYKDFFADFAGSVNFSDMLIQVPL